MTYMTKPVGPAGGALRGAVSSSAKKRKKIIDGLKKPPKANLGPAGRGPTRPPR